MGTHRAPDPQGAHGRDPLQRDPIETREALLESILRAAPIGIGLNLDRVILEVNDVLCRMTGYTREELVGREARILYPSEEDYAYVGSEKFRQIRSLGTGTVETRWLRKDGAIRDILLSSTPIVPGDITQGVTFTALDITEQKIHEKSLHQSEQRIREVLKSSPHPVVVYDAEGLTEYVNPAFTEVFGWTLEDLKGKRIPFVPESEREETVRGIEDLYLKGKSVTLETSRLTKTGRTLRILASAGPIMDAEGRTSGMVVTLTDMTERKLRQEEELARMGRVQRQQASLIRLATHPDIVSGNLTAAFRTLTEEGARTLDVEAVTIWLAEDTHGEVRCMDSFWMRPGLHSQDRRLEEKAYPVFFRALREQSVIAADDTETDPRAIEFLEGTNRPLGISSSLDAAVRFSGRIVGDIAFEHQGDRRTWRPDEIAFASQLADQVAHVLGNAERHKAVEALRASEAQYRELFDHVSDLIYKQDLEGRFTSTNPALAALFGLAPAELLGHKASEFMKPEFREAFDAQYLSGLSEKGFYNGTSCYFARDGTRKYIEYRSRLVTPAGGEPYIAGTGRDVSDRVLQEKRVKDLQDQLLHAQKMEAVGRLAGGVAHDMNNLLTPILGYADLLRTTVVQGDPRRKFVEEIHKAALKAKDLVRQLLALGRKQPLELKTVGVDQIVFGIEKLLRRILREDIEFSIHNLADHATVRADVGQIEQVLMNLVVNAQDAMLEGGCLRIEIRDLAPEEAATVLRLPGASPHVVLSVEDTGCGMDERTLEKIFDPFFTTKEPGKGTGLGLAMACGIVEQHQGAIRVTTRPGQGSTFSILLPLVFDERPVPPAAEGSLFIPRGTETVLVVEDEPMVREMVMESLRIQGYEVISPESATACLRCVQGPDRPAIALLITDVVMPDMNGKELYDRLTVLIPGLKVLFMSGYADEVIAQHGVLMTGLPLLQKPFTVQTLASRVREVLDA